MHELDTPAARQRTQHMKEFALARLDVRSSKLPQSDEISANKDIFRCGGPESGF